MLAGARALLLAVASLAGSTLLLVLFLVSLALVPALGLGLLTTPRVVAWVRAWANWRRLVAVRWGGVRIPPRYRAAPAASALPGPPMGTNPYHQPTYVPSVNTRHSPRASANPSNG